MQVKRITIEKCTVPEDLSIEEVHALVAKSGLDGFTTYSKVTNYVVEHDNEA